MDLHVFSAISQTVAPTRCPLPGSALFFIILKIRYQYQVAFTAAMLRGLDRDRLGGYQGVIDIPAALFALD